MFLKTVASMKKPWLPALVMAGLALLAGLVIGGHRQAPPLQASDAWIKALPPVIRVRAGYLVLHNRDSRPHRLVGARSPAFERIQMHQTLIDDGRMKMVRAQGFSIPAKGTLTLAPGGRHLMMFSPRRPLPAGSEVPVILRFADGGELTVPFEVRP